MRQSLDPARGRNLIYHIDMLVYRLIRTVREMFPLAVFWMYLAMFVMSVPFIFMFPQLTMILFALALASLPFSILTALALRLIQVRVARVILRRERCPSCGERMQTHRQPKQNWSCEFCEARFDSQGMEDRAETGERVGQVGLELA